jgi:integrase
MAVLEEAKGLRDASELVFPSMRGKPLSDMTLSKLVKELGFNADVHGFRTSFRTWAQERTDFTFEVCEAALAHTVGNSASQAYAQSDMLEKRRKLMVAWASYLSVDQADDVAQTVRQNNAA